MITEWFYNSKIYFIGALIVAVIACAFPVALSTISGSYKELDETLSFIPLFVIIVAMSIPGESLSKNIENNMKCRFASLTLCGVTPKAFATGELLKNLIGMGMSAVLGAIPAFICVAVNGEMWDYDIFRIGLLLLLLIYSIDWIAIPLELKIKSKEKSGLILGIIAVAIGAVGFFAVENGCGAYIQELLLGNSLSWLWCVAFCLALYPIGWLLIFLKARKGDI